MATIYRKTAKGHSEIETRAHRLTPRLRSVLIMIDGRRSDDDVRKLIPQYADDTLRLLGEQGFIEMIGITQDLAAARSVNGAAVARPMNGVAVARPAEAAPPLPAPPVAPAVSQREFEATRARAVRLFTDMVGPMAEALAIKMERARSPEELRTLVQTAQRIIGNARGGKAAADYGSRFLDSPGG